MLHFWISAFFPWIAEKYVAYIAPLTGAVDTDFDKLSLGNENGFLWDIFSPGADEPLREDGLPKESTSEVGISDDALPYLIWLHRWCLDKGYVGKNFPDEG